MDTDKLSVALATRLKQERTSRNLSHVALRNALKEQYGIDISKDTLINYETGLNHTKTKKNLGMRVEYLMYFADFFGVSSDYLLGLSDIRTPNLDTQIICKKTGLTEKSLENLQTMIFQNHFGEGVNALFSSEHAMDFFDRVDDCCYFPSFETQTEKILRLQKMIRPELDDFDWLCSELSQVSIHSQSSKEEVEREVEELLAETAQMNKERIEKAKRDRDDLAIYNVQRIAGKMAERIIEETYKNKKSEG